MTLSIAISVLISLAFMLGMWILEIYAQSRVRMMALAMAWGVVFIVASALHDRLLAWDVLNFEQVAMLSAAVGRGAAQGAAAPGGQRARLVSPKPGLTIIKGLERVMHFSTPIPRPLSPQAGKGEQRPSPLAGRDHRVGFR